jgi:hypothetical protein
MRTLAVRIHGAGDLRLESFELPPLGDMEEGLDLMAGGKKLIYTHKKLELTAIDSFAEKGKTDPLFARLAELCGKTQGLWNKEAEDCLLAQAPDIDGGNSQ